ncbi:NACHT domain-containing protein [Streptomyces antibioticus]|uniref:NACHT domain-containing protein n=1 Tax=Streptomyces antibioticus TaxID=1890 RepID=UPI00369B42F9
MKRDLSAGRQALRDALLELEGKALQGRDRTDAIAKANKHRKNTELPPLRPTTVGGWFENGTPAKDFEDLWALVEILLEWSRQLPRTATDPAKAKAARKNNRELWRTRWQQAKDSRPANTPTAGRSPVITGYLAAVRKTARTHPYPDTWGDMRLPHLTDVYVRQQATPQTTADPGYTAPAHSAARPAQHADEIFRTTSRVTVLLAPAGSGKSTLLRTHRAASARRWLDSKADATAPVLINASTLITADPLPAALAKAATDELTSFGLLDELPPDLFRHLPRAKTPWLVMVDGLDEIPDTDTRRAVVQTIAQTAAAEPALYRFVVATRPLPTRELHALGPQVPRFELQPFSPHDLRTYAINWFRDLDDPARHAQAFIAELERSHLDVLAHTPLMAFLLCRLYRTNPRRPLPQGRTGVYQACVELLYEQNTHKNIKTTHDEAIRRLKDRHQIPRDNLAAEQAARLVREQLPELIDYLAHARINGNTAPAVEILTSHLHVIRPQRLKEHLWSAFIGDLLRPTGLLIERGDDFDFLHQTFLEYHAARHATHSAQGRAQLLDQLFPPGRQIRIPAPEPSYLGFLLDALFSSPDTIAAQTISRIEALTHQGGKRACDFLTEQVALRTGLPTKPTARQLTHFAQSETLESFLRVKAAVALARVDGYRDAGAHRLMTFAEDTAFDGDSRLYAVTCLTSVDGYRDAGAHLLARLACDTTLASRNRVYAAEILVEADEDRDRVAQVLARLIDDTTLDGRASAARLLALVDGYRDAGAHRLIDLADNTTLDGDSRVLAAVDLARVDGYRDAGAHRLIDLADNTTLDGDSRALAAQFLALVDGYRDAGAHRLIDLADNTTLDGHGRVQAAAYLVGLHGYRDAGAHRLIDLADNTTLDGDFRVGAAAVLAGVASMMAWVDVTVRAAQVLARLADDPALDGDCRVQAAELLAEYPSIGAEADGEGPDDP